MIDSDFWADQWERARKTSSLYRMPSDSSRWREFWDFYSDKYAQRNSKNMALTQSIVTHLASLNLLKKESEVLDIGCGPGTYTIPMARYCRSVTGLDSSKSMLETLSHEAVKYGLENKINTCAQDWEDAPDSFTYDLVFGGMTPAIKSRETLLKMNHISKNSCCLISTKGGFRSNLRDKLWDLIMGEKLISPAFDMQYPFNILCHEGFLPEVKFFPYRHEYLEDPVFEKEFYRTYFAIFGKKDDRTHAGIDGFIDSQTVNGSVCHIHEGILSVIVWDRER